MTKPKPRSAGVSGGEHGRARTIIEELQGRVEELQEELEAAKAPRGTSRKRPATDSADPINDRIRRVSEFVIEDFAPDFERWLESKPELDTDARYFLNNALEACAMRLQDLAQSLRGSGADDEGGEDSERQPAAP